MKTTAEKIAIMQAFERGEDVEFCDHAETLWYETREPVWDWSHADYRIKPKLIEGWVNVYPEGYGSLYASREDADRHSMFNQRRIRCVKVREVPDDD
jgi:hypothetical protein